MATFDGVWRGTYRYRSSAIANALGVVEVPFELVLESSSDGFFEGSVEDDVDAGGTPGVGRIEGRLVGTSVSWLKQMPVRSTLDRRGKHQVDESRPHIPLLYRGELAADGRSARGKWRFRSLIWWLMGTGTWTARRVEEAS